MDQVNLDFMGILLDEVALEGLDGITMPTLWKRLEKHGKFPLALDDYGKQFIWECLLQHQDIEYFELKEPRPPLVIYNRYSNVDLEMGIVLDADETLVEIYPHAPIQSPDLKGSCATFHTRVNISAELKAGGKNYMAVMQTYGEEIVVLVASQEQRNLALFGCEVYYNLEINLDQYCILERIGRSRYHGEVTMGRLSLSQMKIPNKKMFYLRKDLLKQNLITKQVHLQRIGNITQHSSLFHLKRFFVERLSKVQVMIMKMCEILKEKPNNREIFSVLRSELGMKEGSFKKMFNKTFQVCVQAKMIPYGDFYPDASHDKKFSMNGKEKQVKVAVLVKNYEEPEEEGEFEDEEEEKNDVGFMDPRRMLFDRPILSQIYNVVEKSGPIGINSTGLRQDLGMSKLEIRLLLRNLERRNAIFTVMQDMGRQRASFYIAKCYEQENLANSKLQAMKQKIISYASTPALDDSVNDDGYQAPVHNDTFNDLNSVVVDYLEDDQPEVTTKAWNFSLKDISNVKDKDIPNYTYKMLKRVNLVIEAVKMNRLIEDPFRIQKLIIQNEQDEGLTEKIDKKSTQRIINRLAKDGYIRSIKTQLTMGERIKKLHFICDSTITPDDPLVQSAIEQSKLKYFSSTKQTAGSTPLRPLRTAHTKELSDSGFELRNMIDAEEGKTKLEYISSIGRSYGLLPKFLRLRALHLFMYYLVYDYQGCPTPIQLDGEGSPAVYHLSETWRRFVPPLPQHAGKPLGWCLVSDVILCMPLCLLLKVVNFTYRIAGIEEYLNDNIKQNYLLRHLPQKIRNLLLHSRKYIFTVHEVLMKLSFMGLMSFGPQQYKEKDQIFVFLHQNATLKDTSLSKPGYMKISHETEYHTMKYHMTSYEDAENYWYDLENICMHTPLGTSRNTNSEVKNIFRDPLLLESARQKTVDEIVDEGVTPGDGFGAGGLDSGMFGHLKRNWSWPAESASHLKRLQSKKSEFATRQGIPVGVSYMKYLAESEEAVGMSDFAKTKRLSRLAGKNKLILPEPVSVADEDDILEVPKEAKMEIKTSLVPNIVNRKGFKRKRSSNGAGCPAKVLKKAERKLTVCRKKEDKLRKPYYDEQDQIALNKMSKQRVCWSVQEDSFLLLCKVASCILDPHHKGLVIQFSIIREIMHDRFPTLSYNKTSRACQRRICFMMRNPTTVANVSVFLLEAKQDVELVRQFQGPKPIRRDEKAWTQMFTTVLNHLLEKFTLSLKDRCVQLFLPHSMEKFNQLYKVSVTGEITDRYHVHTDPKNSVDIYCSVMFCFILSSMLTIGDKNSWSYTLYRVYQQYPDTLLRSVVGKLKRDRLITKRKNFSSRNESVIPLSSLPHKLSVHFDMNLQSRYQSHIYDTAANLFRIMARDHSLPEPQGIEVSGHIEPGDAALILSLNVTQNVVFNIQVPEQVIIFDSSMTEDMKTRIQEKVKQYVKENAENLGEGESKELTEEVVNETPFEVSASKASRIALYMLRHELGNSIADNLQHAQDYFLINMCGLRCTLRLPEFNRWYPLSPFKAQSAMDLQKILLPLEAAEQPTSSDIHAIYVAHTYPNDVVQDGVKLMNYISDSKELGCTYAELYSFSLEGLLTIKDHLKFLTINNLILRVGVTCFRYVSFFYSKPWIVTSYKVLKDERSKATNIAKDQAHDEVIQAKRAKLILDGQTTKAMPMDSNKETNSIETEVVLDGVERTQSNEVLPPMVQDISDALCEADLKVWFNENVMIRVENSSSLQSLPSIDIMEPEQHELVETVQLLKEPFCADDCFNKMRETLDSAVKMCVQDLLNKTQTEFTEESAYQSLNDWFQNDVLQKVENEELRNWLQTFVMTEVETIVDKESVRDLLTKKVLAKVEMAIESEHGFIKKWLDETVLFKINEEESPPDIREWLQELLRKVYDSLEDQPSEEDGQLMLWMNEILKKVAAINSTDVEKHKLKDWFERTILFAVESNIPSETLQLHSLKPVLDAVNDLECKERIKLFREVSKRLDQLLGDVVQEETSLKDLQKWFSESVMCRIQKQICESEEISCWFEQNVLQSLEKSNTDVTQEVKDWLQQEIVKLLNIIEPQTTISELQEWLEQNILNVLQAIKPVDCAEHDTEVNGCLNDSILQVIENTQEHDKPSAATEEIILDTTDSTSDLTNQTGIRVDVESCLQDKILEIMDCTTSIIDLSANIADSGACLQDSCLDVIDTTTDIVNMTCDNADSDSCLKGSLDIIESTTDLVTESVNMVETATCLTESILDIVDSSTNLVDHAANQVESEFCLKESVLDVIDSTTNLVESTVNHADVSASPNDKILDVIDSTNHLADCASVVQPVGLNSEIDNSDERNNIEISLQVNSCLNDDLLSIVETTSTMVCDVNQSETTSTIVCDVNQTETKLESIPNPISDNNNADVCSVDMVNISDYMNNSLLDVVATTSLLVTEVSSSRLTDTTAAGVEDCEMDTSKGISEDLPLTTCLNESILDVIDTTNGILNSLIEDRSNINKISSSHISDLVENVLDIVQISAGIVDSADKICLDQTETQASCNPQGSTSNSQPLGNENELPTNIPLLGENCGETQDSQKSSEANLEQGGKRKRKRPVSFGSTSFSRKAAGEPVRFISRPWRKPDGTLNRKALERYLTTILGHIMANPGISQTQLFEKFETTMQPVIILELVEILTECECLTTFHVSQSHSPGLFTDTVNYSFVLEWQPSTEAYYEGTVDAILKLSYFLSNFLHYRQ